MSDPKKELAKSKYIAGEEIVAIAKSIGVDRKTIQRWIKAHEGTADDWRVLREANQKLKVPEPPKVVVLQPRSDSKPDERIRQRPFRSETGMSDLELIECTIAELYASLAEAEDRSKGGIASAIVKLIEQKHKLNPPTIEDLVDQVLDWLKQHSLNPVDFARVLRQRWEGRNRA